MGEAKRRKQLDPTWGKPKLHTLRIDGNELKIEARLFKGHLTPIDGEDYLLEIEASNNEIDFLEMILEVSLSQLLEKYNYAKVKYIFKFDLTNLISKKSSRLELYPEYWDYAPSQMRESRCVELNLVPMLENDANKTDKNERSTPAEHIRRAHKRRVAYGKGRSLRKWVDIPETVVNAR